MQVLNTRLGVLLESPDFRANSVLELTPKRIMELIREHEKYKVRYELLMDYYLGKHVIQNRKLAEDKPNNRLTVNFPEYITDVKTGYTVGNPVTYAALDNSIMEQLQFILDYNDEQDLNSEILKLSSIFGHSFEVHWLDKNGIPRFTKESPYNMFVIRSNSIEHEILGAVRYTTFVKDGKNLRRVELMLSDKIVILEGSNGTDTFITKETPHIYGDVPVVEVINNDNKIGDFENVISLVDAYELVFSDSVNESQYFSDAYLVIKNMLETDDTNLQDMKNNRVIILDDEGEASWLTKSTNDTFTQNILDRLEKDIYRSAKVPDLTDEAFGGNITGVAIRFKLWGLEQDVMNKERKFKKALQRRFELLSNILNVLNGKSFNWTDIKIMFSRNLPSNAIEQVDIVTKLQGRLPESTLLSLLPFVEDPEHEKELLKEESQASE